MLALTDRSAAFAPLPTLLSSEREISRKPDVIMGRWQAKWNDHGPLVSEANGITPRNFQPGNRPHKDRMATPKFGK